MSLRDRLLASDPPLERWRMAARALVALVLAGVPLLALTRAGIVPGNGAVLGGLVAVWGSFQANDPEPRARRVTALLQPVVAAVSVTLSTLLGAVHPFVAALAFLAIAFPAIWVRRYGPRGFGLGMMALLTNFYAIFVHLPPAQLLAAIGAIAIGGAGAFVAHFAIVTDRPRTVLRAAAVAFRARLRLACEAIDALAGPGAAGDAEPLRHALLALDAAALEVDRLVAGDAFALDPAVRQSARRAVLDAEVAVDRLATHALARTLDGASPPGARLAHAFGERVEAAVAPVLAAPLTGRADAPLSAGPAPPPIGGLEPSLRLAIQVTTAAAAAMAIGAAIPPHLFAWALLTSFLVYNRVASAAEARRRTIARIAGTIAGVGIGFVLVEFVHGRGPVELAVAAVAGFGAAYTFRASYLAFTLLITVAIAALYDVVGRPAADLLAARLVETIVGAVCGGLVASFVLPVRTPAAVAVEGRRFADALRAWIGACATDGDRTHPLDAARDVDARAGDLIARADPLVHPRGGTPSLAAGDARAAIVDCAYRVRSATAALLAVHAGRRRGAAAAVQRRIERGAAALADAFRGGAAGFDDARWTAIAREARAIAVDLIVTPQASAR